MSSDDGTAGASPERPSLACIELVELVTEYLDGTLAPEERVRVDAHLAKCAGCTAYVEQMRQVAAAAGRLTPEAVPEEAVDRLLEAFRNARRP